MPQTMEALKTRIGPLGQLYDAPFQADLVAPRRFATVADFLVGHGFRTYGLSTQTRIHPSQLPAWRQCAADAGLDVQLVSTVSNPLDSPTFTDGQVRLHASAEVHARRHEQAAAGGMKSYTIISPTTSAVTLDDLAREVGYIRDRTKGNRVTLRYMNGPTGTSLLPDLDKLLEFCTDNDVRPTLHGGLDFAVTGRQRSVDEWRMLLKAAGPETLLCYANYRPDPAGGLGISIYDDESTASPQATPILQAALEARNTTVLVQGDRPEADALGVMRTQAELEGRDIGELLSGLSFRQKHRRVASLVPGE